MDSQARSLLVAAINLVMDELNRAAIKHPRWPLSDLRRAAVVTEEAGELLRAALTLEEFRDRLPPVTTGTEFAKRLDRERVLRREMQIEAAQTAAMALRFLIHHSLEPLVYNSDAKEN